MALWGPVLAFFLTLRWAAAAPFAALSFVDLVLLPVAYAGALAVFVLFGRSQDQHAQSRAPTALVTPEVAKASWKRLLEYRTYMNTVTAMLGPVAALPSRFLVETGYVNGWYALPLWALLWGTVAHVTWLLNAEAYHDSLENEPPAGEDGREGRGENAAMRRTAAVAAVAFAAFLIINVPGMLAGTEPPDLLIVVAAAGLTCLLAVGHGLGHVGMLDERKHPAQDRQTTAWLASLSGNAAAVVLGLAMIF